MYTYMYTVCNNQLNFEVQLSKFLLPTDSQENCFQRSIKIYVKTPATSFDVITIIRERTM